MATRIIRRWRLMAGCWLGATMLAAPQAQARIDPTTMNALVAGDHQPADPDERGLWDSLERFEEELATYDRLVRDPALTAYLTGLVRRLTRESGTNFRVYVIRDPAFNAFAAPNGMLLINSGALLRMRDEAQLAGLLAHECGHFLRQHQLRGWRDRKARGGAMAFLTLGLAIGGAAARVHTGDLIQAVNNVIFFGAFAYSRELEAEADAMGLRLIEEAGYAPRAMEQIWAQHIEEQTKSHGARGRRRPRGGGLLDTHPSNDQRMADMNASAEQLADPEASYETGKERFEAAMRPHRAQFLSDQIAINDSGATLYLLDWLAADGWTGLLRFAEGEAYRLRDEEGDRDRAHAAYAAAVALTDAPPEAWRGYGYSALRRNETEAGRAALMRYLELTPDAEDAEMVRFSLQ